MLTGKQEEVATGRKSSTAHRWGISLLQAAEVIKDLIAKFNRERERRSATYRKEDRG